MMQKEKAKFTIRPGTIIRGKWHQKKYYVVKKLGAGMIGTVYLCRQDGEFVALKISDQALSMTTEVNVLKALQKHQRNLGPQLLDVDDWEVSAKKQYSFYVMEYIRGENVKAFIKRNGAAWVGIVLIQLLDQLARLHDSGWVFGDLKNDNLLMERDSSTVRLIDVGGTTKIGRSIKEYTEFHDRGYWGLGSRKAEPSYDLFALVMVVLKVYHPDRFKRQQNNLAYLQKKISTTPALRLYTKTLQKAIAGKYATATEMRNDMMEMLVNRQEKQKGRAKKKRFRLLESLLLCTMTSVYGIAIYFLF